LAAFGRRTRLVWRKHRWACRNVSCRRRSWTAKEPTIAAPRPVLTDRAGRWATEQVGRCGRSVEEIAVELGCDWHTVNDAVIAYRPIIAPARMLVTTSSGRYRHARSICAASNQQ